MARGSIVSNLSEIHGATNREKESLCLRLSINNEVPICAALLFSEGIFDSECFIMWV